MPPATASPGSRTRASRPSVTTGICGDLDEQLDAFRTWPLDHIRFPVCFDVSYARAASTTASAIA
ncbi:hypothetical protein [Streptomyces sp. NPDC053728]|uniref:hypothetical protein n=1 Tax=Streptomyces sp. NPDC053728 TaxID=3155534 RepID=UPI003444E006